MRVIINGLGCPHTGARFILDQVLLSTPPDVQVTAFVPIVEYGSGFQAPAHVRLIKLKHSIWGMYLRVFLEAYINLLMLLKRYDRLINLSNYGLCFSRNQILYIHNPLLLDMNAPTRLGNGNPNAPIRFALNTCLRNADCIFVQTEHMYRQLQLYCTINSIRFPQSVQIFRPPLPLPSIDQIQEAISKTFEFQLFYPASQFPHKRADLSIEATRLARKSNDQIGLNITIDPLFHDEGINFLGPISRAEVYRHFKASDAMLFTSERETLGLPLLESIYFEKPAILPNKAYAREVCGDAGIYYDKDTPEAISRAILYLTTNYQEAVNRVKIKKKEIQETQQSWAQHWEAFLTCKKNTPTVLPA